MNNYKTCVSCQYWHESKEDEELGICELDADETYYDESCCQFRRKHKVKPIDELNKNRR